MEAATAYKWGVVNRVVGKAALMETACEMAPLGRAAPQVVRLAKRLIRHGAPDVAARMTKELPLFSERLG
jgi:enoyl-CoA hydratase/carnithine racemase